MTTFLIFPFILIITNELLDTGYVVLEKKDLHIYQGFRITTLTTNI
jgi:hypothetical protein